MKMGLGDLFVPLPRGSHPGNFLVLLSAFNLAFKIGLVRADSQTWSQAVISKVNSNVLSELVLPKKAVPLLSVMPLVFTHITRALCPSSLLQAELAGGVGGEIETGTNH